MEYLPKQEQKPPSHNGIQPLLKIIGIGRIVDANSLMGDKKTIAAHSCETKHPSIYFIPA